MNENLTELVVVMDKSGSMEPLQNDAIGGFNTFLKSQKEAPGEAKMTVVLFDTSYSFYAANVDVKNVKPLDASTYKPDGGTALYDALCTTIDEIGKKLAAMKEEDRPARVIFAILTDGEENSSRQFNRKEAFDRIARQRDQYKWDFLFLAAGEGAFQAGESIGMTKSKIAMFKNDSKGQSASYNAMSNYAAASRSVSLKAYEDLSANFDTQMEVNAMLAGMSSTIDLKKTETAPPPDKDDQKTP